MMSDMDPIADLLQHHGLRPTRQRLLLARRLLDGPDRHVTAEELHREAEAAGEPVSLATVYNTLNHLRDVGLLREISVGPGQSWFDTNLRAHFHLFNESTGELSDLPPDAIGLTLPELPGELALTRVDVILRVSRRPDDDATPGALPRER
jgi:Fur family iron response transcriptional regulator